MQRRGHDGMAGSFCRQGTGVGAVTDHSGCLLENGGDSLKQLVERALR